MIQPWWWLSFAEGEQFLGATIVQAGTTIESALVVAQVLEIHPGGEAVGFPMDDDRLPNPGWRGRLLTLAEAQHIENEANRLWLEADEAAAAAEGSAP